MIEHRCVGLTAFVLAVQLCACGMTHDPVDGGVASDADDSLDGGAAPDAHDPVVDTGPPSPPDSGLPFDAGTDAGPSCDPGATRVSVCGACGTESQACDDSGHWMATSACLGQGECIVGTVETRTGERCAEDQRICLDGCVFGDWEQTGPPRDCEPGETRAVSDGTCGPGEGLPQRCSGACTWAADGSDCVDACGSAQPARTSPEASREVCVPAGPFVRGEPDTFFSPQATIELSSFYIDVYPVTYRRYADCVIAGACREPEGIYARNEAAYLDYPVQGIERQDTIDFCRWDGGRVLPTSMQWEKAARGPAPRDQSFPWGDARDCTAVPTASAPCNEDISEALLGLDPITAFDASVASFYGTSMMGFGVLEWVHDKPCVDWYSSADSTAPDASCEISESAATQFVVRSSSRQLNSPVWSWATLRPGPGPAAYRSTGFRCARAP